MQVFAVDVNHERVKGLELCQVPASRRLVTIGKESFYLPLPPILFCQTIVECDYGTDRCLGVAFATDEVRSLDDVVYFPPLPNIYVDHWIGKWRVCLGRNNGSNLQGAIERFWSTSFSDYGQWKGLAAAYDIFGGYENWSRLNNVDALACVKQSRSLKVRQFLLKKEYKVPEGAFNGFIRRRTL